MIPEHQPKGFDPKRVFAAISSKEDGNMRSENGGGDISPEADENRRRWLVKQGISYDAQAVRMWVTFDPENTYQEIVEVSSDDAGTSIKADVLVTSDPNVALVVQEADCAVAVIYDPVNKKLAEAHLGRHSSEVDLAVETVKYLKKRFGSEPSDLQIWISPAIGMDHHTLEWFNSLGQMKWEPFVRVEGDKIKIDIQAFNRFAFVRAGVPDENIEICNVDTYTHPEYYSHRESTDLNMAIGRQAVVAMMYGPEED